jgi:TonB family protein
VKDEIKCKRSRLSLFLILAISNIIVATCAVSVAAQQAPTDAENLQKRLARARALTAANSLTAAAFELDAIRKSTTDDVLRDVARIMLMGVYLEQADYGRAQNLLDETYQARNRSNESSCRSYFAVAGQTMNGIRSHLDRFRMLGLNVTSKDLPSEAVSDLDRVRSLLDRIAQQAKDIGSEDNKNTDAFALLEDVASVRSNLARNLDERERWQGEIAMARQHLAASDTRLASLTGKGAPPPQAPATTPSGNRPANVPISLESKPPVQVETNRSVEPAKNPGAVSSNDLSSTPATGEHVNVGSLIEQAIQKVNPVYPAFAKTAHVAGIVRVDLVIDENGTVISAESSSGPSVLRQAAIDASRRWKFRPVVRDGRPVRATGFLSFNFSPR